MAETLIEVTDAAIQKILQKQTEERFDYIRLGITGVGCAGFSYIFDHIGIEPDKLDVVVDYGKFKIVIDRVSLPYLVGTTLDFVKEGLNEIFTFINPKETSHCGCGVSITFDLNAVEQDENKIKAIQL